MHSIIFRSILYKKKLIRTWIYNPNIRINPNIHLIFDYIDIVSMSNLDQNRSEKRNVGQIIIR